MLSRVAESTYWLGRYLERIENTARIVHVNMHLMLDLPEKVSNGWEPIIRITGNSDDYKAQHQGDFQTQKVWDFLIADLNQPASMLNAITNARWNARMVREILQAEIWAKINELYYIAKEDVQDLEMNQRSDYLDTIIEYCQLLVGAVKGTMSHGPAYEFLMAGMYIERADMSSRALDILSSQLIHKHADDERYLSYENLLQENLLKSLCAYQAYRQAMSMQVSIDRVIRFIFDDPHFPRSLTFCLTKLYDSIRRLPPHYLLDERFTSKFDDIYKLMNKEIIAHNNMVDIIDDIQIGLDKIHTQISKAYF